MKSQFTVREGNSRLLMFFSGWGSDASVVDGLRFPGYDVMALYDYRSPDFDVNVISGYQEIVIAAWSFGVAAAACFAGAHTGLPITRRVAINGTLYPIDDSKGIPQAIFQGTLDGLDQRNLTKFIRRTTLGRSYTSSRTDIDELKQELRAVAALNVPQQNWDMAFVADDDRIIPPANQIRAWSGTPVRTIAGPHLPDFEALLAPLMIDKNRVARSFGAASASYDAEASVQARIVDNLLSHAELDPAIAVEIGSGTGLLTRKFLQRYAPGRLTLVDFNPVEIPGALAVAADAERWIAQQAEESFTCVMSSSAMQWFNSPLTFLHHVSRVLKPGGTALISTFGPETMRELEGISPRLPYLYPSELPGVVDTEIITLSFDSPTDIMRHMRLTGVNALSTGPSHALRAARLWPRNPDGRYSLTYQPIYIKITK